MKLELYYDSTVEPFRSPEFGVERVFVLLERLKERGIPVKVYDTAGWERDMIREKYLRACVPAMVKKYRISRIFGTGGERGLFFGRQVPAVLAVEDKRVVDIYPHEKGGRILTVAGFLEELLEGGT